MNRQQCANKKDSNSVKSDCLQGQENVFDLPGIGLMFSEHDFMDWCSTMSIQDIQIQFRVYFPQAIQYFRENVHEFGENWTIKPIELVGMTSSFRNFVINNYHKFLKALVFTSDKDYLDSLTFSSECFLFPDRIYKLLCNIKAISCHIAQNHGYSSESKISKMSQPQTNQIIKLQLVDKIVKKIQKNLDDKMKLKFRKSISQESVELIQEFNLYWKYCCEQEKNSIWCLGYNDIKKAAYKLLGFNQKFDLSKIIEFINNAQKTSSKQLGDKMFSWKLLQNDDGVTNYMQLIFRQLKDRINKNNRDGSKYRNKKIKKRKQKQKYIRRNSIDQSSNQTNQTDIQYQRGFDININQIIQTKLQKDILQLSDQINQQANSYYQNRQLGYQRLRHLLGCLNINTKIYGSCCAGLAIKNSDIDVTIEQNILQEYFGYLSDTSLKIDALFQYLQTFLINFQCISNIKIISSASIPIMKFTIDNRIKLYSQYYFSQQIHQFLNKQVNNLGPVQIDLTVQTTQVNRQHLGMISTRQTKQWLNQIPTLQAIAIILKNQLANKLLNQTYYGGINTYTLLVMLVGLIRRERLSKETNIAVVFQKVLRFYSLEFQEDKTGIDLNFNGIFYPKNIESTPSTSLATSRTKTEGQGERLLEVKDPLGNKRNITRNCYQFKVIKQIFKDIYENCFIATKKRVQELCSIWNPKQNPFHEERLIEWVDKEMEEDNKFFRLLKLE